MEPEEAVAILEKKVNKLKEEVHKMTEIIITMDQEVNRQFKKLQAIKTYCESNNQKEILEIIEKEEK